MLEVLYHRTKFGGARISLAAGVAKNVEFFLFVYFLTAALRAAQRAGISVTQRPILRFYAPQTERCTDWGEIFTPIGATIRV